MDDPPFVPRYAGDEPPSTFVIVRAETFAGSKRNAISIETCNAEYIRASRRPGGSLLEWPFGVGLCGVLPIMLLESEPAGCCGPAVRLEPLVAAPLPR
eukprot:4542003-Pleurochrysis_carterae.AAC.3